MIGLVESMRADPVLVTRLWKAAVFTAEESIGQRDSHSDFRSSVAGDETV